jgi:hypothetical protein
MPPKPHRVLLDRVAGYAEEAGAYLRRRRLDRSPFARVYTAGGRSRALDSRDELGRGLFLAASHVIDAARPAADGGDDRAIQDSEADG